MRISPQYPNNANHGKVSIVKVWRLASRSPMEQCSGGFRRFKGDTNQSGTNPANPKPAWTGYDKMARWYVWPALGNRESTVEITSYGMFNSANIKAMARASAAKP